MNDKEVTKKALAELDSAFIDVTIHAQAAFALVRYVRDLEMQITALQKQITAAAQPSRAEVLTDDEILQLAATVLGNPFLFEDLKQDFTVHTEAGDWIKFARALKDKP